MDRWSGPAARTALELIPGKRIRPTAAYFRAGHLVLDSLTRRFIELNDLQRDERQATAAPLSPPYRSAASSKREFVTEPNVCHAGKSNHCSAWPRSMRPGKATTHPLSTASPTSLER